MEELDIHKQIKVLLDQATHLLNHKKDFGQAKDTLHKLESMDSENPVVLYNLAIVCIHLQDYNSAIDYLKRCMLLPMTFIDIRQVRKVYIFTLMQKGDYDRALDELQQQNDQDDAIIQMKAFALEKKGNYRQALQLYENILEDNPDNVNACNAIAYIIALLPDGNLSKALELAKKAVSHAPNNAAYNDTLGYVYYKRGEYNMAKKFLKKALSLKPDNSEIRSHIDELLNIS
ncbi:MAG: tetratricopeptide repeat protein [Spirochaetes bacterium]|nr:tetratricopeptide repeat protein [Spirochaetota bacterium]